MSHRVWLLLSVLSILGAAFAGCLADEEAPESGDGTGEDAGDGSDGGTGGTGADGGDGGDTGAGGDGDASGAVPIADFTFEADGDLMAGTNISFNASSSEDPDGTNLTYAWDFGDGNTAEGESVVHVYADAGNFTVVLNVTDADGASSEVNETLVIAEGGASDYSETLSGSLAAPHPALAFMSSGSTLSDYELAGGAEGTTYQLHELDAVPSDGTTLSVSLQSSTAYMQFVVFDGAGDALAKNDFPNGADDVTLTDEEAQIGHYFVLVWSAAHPGGAYDITVTLA